MTPPAPTKKPPRKRAAKVGYSKALVSGICARMAGGASLRAVCRQPDMPSHQTFLHWVSDRPGVAAVYARACEFRAVWIADEILELADTPLPGQRVKLLPDGKREVVMVDNVERSRLQISARQWLLGKLAPKRFGDKITTEITGPDGGPIATAVKERTEKEMIEFAALMVGADRRARPPSQPEPFAE